jgi:malate synthase
MSVTVGGLEVTGELRPGYADIINNDAMTLVGDLVRKFAGQLDTLFAMRHERQARWDEGELPDFLPETKSIRDTNWHIKGIPSDLRDRRVEITGPVDRKMIINALNADVKVFMADFEDATTPTWQNLMDGQINLRDANRGQISFEDEARGKTYTVQDDPAVLIARVRGLHLPEKNVLSHGKPIPGCLFDFGLYFYHNYRTLQAKGSGPYFYIPKIQSHYEARWWNDVFVAAEQAAGLEIGTIKATFLIETLPAVFEMDEIIYELKDHIVALNCGRWDYIFSYIKTLKNHGDRVLPDRQAVTMDKPFLDAYSRLLIKTCHRRGAMAMGGMSAFIPAKDEEQNAVVRQKVTDDKTREAANGHDGTWVAHPGLASIVNPIFGKALGASENQLGVTRGNDQPVSADDLLESSDGDCTEDGMRHNIRVALQYLEAWIGGNGCVPIYGLMEDAATAEISRASIWQWIRHGVKLTNGKAVTRTFFETLLKEEIEAVKEEIGETNFKKGRFEEAAKIFSDMTTSEDFGDFLTLPAYELI